LFNCCVVGILVFAAAANLLAVGVGGQTTTASWIASSTNSTALTTFWYDSSVVALSTFVFSSVNPFVRALVHVSSVLPCPSMLALTTLFVRSFVRSIDRSFVCLVCLPACLSSRKFTNTIRFKFSDPASHFPNFGIVLVAGSVLWRRMVHGAWCMLEWCMVHACMVHGAWCMVHGSWCIYGVWCRSA
jgi:hypothetical protein